jgi:hypothetical protein
MRKAFLTQSASLAIAERFQAECLRKPSSKPVLLKLPSSRRSLAR